MEVNQNQRRIPSEIFTGLSSISVAPFHVLYETENKAMSLIYGRT